MHALTLTAALIAVAVLAQSGCSVLPCNPKTQHELAPSKIIGTARVMEGILQGQRLNIPQTGLTLGEAIYTARRPGSLEGEAADHTGDACLWVEIRRGSNRIFIPLNLVQNSIAGSIQVAPGDVLDLWQTHLVGYLPGFVDEADSRLALESPPTPRDMFTVTGLHTSPGRHAHTHLVGELPARSLEELAKDADDGVTIALLSRQSGPLTDQYVIPVNSAKDFGFDSSLTNNAIIRDHDIINFTRLEFLDMTMMGARKAQLAREALRRQDQLERETICDRVDERLDQSNGIVGRIHDSFESTRRRVQATVSQADGACFVPL